MEKCAKTASGMQGVLQTVNISVVFARFLLTREVQQIKNDVNQLEKCAETVSGTEGVLQNVNISLVLARFLLTREVQKVKNVEKPLKSVQKLFQAPKEFV